ncbi:hypothetical protein GMAR_ORF6 [Golden Marseillevirus]|uniref:replication n=1 Tax=Golden Marseillevirus TaxID=1720526 RepID=UPI000877AE87|nr:replication [Golden Marseillevirus]ALX27381.1 hypothetical protein GMAR_ORF6 [Golden Marseillevirus]
MGVPAKVLPQQTNSNFSTLYTLYQPNIFEKGRCVVCDCCVSETKKHFSLQSHKERFETSKKLPHATSKWWEKNAEEDEIQHFFRMDIALSLGPLPSYIKCVFAYGTVWFFSWSEKKSESMKERSKRGEKDLKGPQYFAHLYAQNRSEFFTTCQLPWFSGARAFGSYKDLSLFQENRAQTAGPQHFYEQFLQGQKVREFWDLELEDEQRCWGTRDVSQLFEKARKEFCSWDDPKFYVLDSSDSKKFSCHIMVSCVHKNIFCLSKFCEEFIAWIKQKEEYSFLTRVLDKGVYRNNGSIRCPGSTKYGSDRVLKVYGCCPQNEEELFVTGNQAKLLELWKKSERRKNTKKQWVPPEEENVPEDKGAPLFEQSHDAEDFMNAIDKFVSEKLDDAFEYDTDWDGTGRLDLKRIQGVENVCPCCTEDEGNVHDRRDAYFTIWNNLLLFGCWKTKRKRLVCRLGPQQEKEKKVFTSDFSYNSENINPIVFPKGRDCLIIRSAMGTGKTKAVIRWVEDNPKARVLFLSYRVSLVTELSKKIPGAVLYTDAKAKKGGCISSKILVCQIDSLHLVCGSFDMVVNCMRHCIHWTIFANL